MSPIEIMQMHELEQLLHWGQLLSMVRMHGDGAADLFPGSLIYAHGQSHSALMVSARALNHECAGRRAKCPSPSLCGRRAPKPRLDLGTTAASVLVAPTLRQRRGKGLTDHILSDVTHVDWSP